MDLLGPGFESLRVCYKFTYPYTVFMVCTNAGTKICTPLPSYPVQADVNIFHYRKSCTKLMLLNAELLQS
jgi:hypothetical protein